MLNSPIWFEAFWAIELVVSSEIEIQEQVLEMQHEWSPLQSDFAGKCLYSVCWWQWVLMLCAIMLITRWACNIIIGIHEYNCTLLPPKNYFTCVYICGLQWLIIIIIIIFFFFFFFWCRQQLSADLWGVLQRENNQTRRVCTYVSQATRMDQISEAMENWEKKKEE